MILLYIHTYIRITYNIITCIYTLTVMNSLHQIAERNLRIRRLQCVDCVSRPCQSWFKAMMILINTHFQADHVLIDKYRPQDACKPRVFLVRITSGSVSLWIELYANDKITVNYNLLSYRTNECIQVSVCVYNICFIHHFVTSTYKIL
ncbi:hypothetical protein M378DRAFT_534589 [Amanita muscaria Koide BX008]|uniref:Uncharacterized protein n=1 Tax=Amanita muscaria (strain Koide BX008) TaxID=946122 RepID=A0A0C2WTZ9_AMAMK|nr:hypothetical protein M378DRAFT_534589 [Amanita muscaria Koide BX008]